MDKNQNLFTVNIDIKFFESLVEFHINNAVAAAFANIESQKAIPKPQMTYKISWQYALTLQA